MRTPSDTEVTDTEVNRNDIKNFRMALSETDLQVAYLYGCSERTANEVIREEGLNVSSKTVTERWKKVKKLVLWLKKSVNPKVIKNFLSNDQLNALCSLHGLVTGYDSKVSGKFTTYLLLKLQKKRSEVCITRSETSVLMKSRTLYPESDCRDLLERFRLNRYTDFTTKIFVLSFPSLKNYCSNATTGVT